MRKQIQVVAAVALAIGSLVEAQQAVQWRVEDGGNGHWYQIRDEGAQSWQTSRQRAESLGGHLATLTSSAESAFVASLKITNRAIDLGGFQDRSAPDFLEPAGGWRWVTGEPWSYTNWLAGEPNDVAPSEDFLFFAQTNVWGDKWGDGGNFCAPCEPHFFAVEWSGDCNNDGIVDYGQIMEGSLADTNGNNVPDCCESGAPCAPNIILNGGFEIGASQTDCTWVVHSEGGSFVPGWTVIAASIDRVRISASCPPSTESWMSFQGEFTIDLDGFTHGGAMSQMVATEPGSTYLLTFQLTGNCAPGVKRMRVEIGSTQYPFEHACSGTNPQPWSEKSIEFTAASSTTNIVFRSLSTDGRNGAVIDSVRLIRLDPQQPTCRDADFFPDRNINGVDLGVLLSQWGAPTQYTVADLNRDGVVDGVDLGIFLAFWGPCPY